MERTSGLIPERQTFFKVDPRGTFIKVLNGATDLPQLHAAWFGLNKRIGLAQENLGKYEAQYRRPFESSDFVVPTSPISTDPEIYEVMSDLGEIDSRMRYLYQSVPHLQDEIHSPRKLTDGSTWDDILPLPENLAELHYSQVDSPAVENRQIASNSKGKGRDMNDSSSRPTSPRMLNIGYGTPFRSSSQFFDKPDRQRFPLPAPSVLARQNVLVGLGLPNTPAFQNIENPPPRRLHAQSRQSNPFQQRNQTNLNIGVPSDSLNLPRDSGFNNSGHLGQGTGGRGGSGSSNPSGGSGGGNGGRGNDPYGDQDGDSNEGSIPSQTNNRHNVFPRNNAGGDPPGGDPPGGGGGNGPPGRGNFGNPRNDSHKYLMATLEPLLEMI